HAPHQSIPTRRSSDLLMRVELKNESQEDEYFKKHYAKHVKTGNYYWIASILSERLRTMDKRAKQANKRADTLHHDNIELRDKIRSEEHTSELQSREKL